MNDHCMSVGSSVAKVTDRINEQLTHEFAMTENMHKIYQNLASERYCKHNN